MIKKQTIRNFSERILAVVRKIPKGKTLTYQQVAKKGGSPRAYRAVGSILTNNYDKNIPCHRVIRSDGSLGKYNKGTPLKKRLLEKEKSFKLG